jgi:CheY-like chemotaxis protein/AraC-like DNA-binding protein/anti-sigma regulatory factor (Ser/Thr protein kinase)
MEKILYNLLSNAIKYTSYGKIKVEISLKTRNLTEYTDQCIEIIVKDTGSGIPADDIPHIFDRFYQAKSGNNGNEGTGIGLSLTQELVKLHKGEILVKSTESKGTTFTVYIPQVTADLKDAINTIAEEAEVEFSEEPNPEEGHSTRFTILIAEDNDEMRNYLASELKPDFDILKAKDGAKALEECKKHHPDLVLSDIAMPGADGLEFCRKLKNDISISHIPVIITTALSSMEYQEQAYRYGADDYITKPFKIGVLKEKINNFIANRDALKRQFLQNIHMEPSILKIAIQDEMLLKKAHAVIEENLADPEFDIDQFAHKTGISRSQLYRKLKALTGLPASEYVKIIRIKTAARLISEQKISVGEAASRVGFKDPKYFSKCFQKHFGVLPSRFKEEEIGAM